MSKANKPSKELSEDRTMSSSNKRRSLNMSRETLDSRTMSLNSLGSITSKPPTLKDEIDNIRDSLDSIKNSILSQQFEIAREFEDRVRQTYDGVINDLNEVRKKVNTLGDEVAADKKFKKWVPVAPFRKEVLQNIYEIRKPSKLTSSKSVDFVDSCERDKSHKGPQNNHSCSGFVGQGRFSSGKLKMASSSDLHKTRLGKSNTSLDWRFNSTVSLHRQTSASGGSTTSVSGSRTQVPGFGCCFTGDNKTYPYRTYRAKYYSFYRYQRPGHSWGPSRSGSRSTLDDDDWWDEDKGCMCGVVPDDWRVRVAPYMWEGWPLPGLDKMDVERLRERLKKFDEIRDDLVEVQNEYRSKHNCPSLTVTEELSRGAQEWAEILAMKGYAQYSDSQSRGENILVVDIEEELSGRQVVETWYRESRDFNYKHPGWQRGTSNFSQMIWKSSREVGVGIAKFPHADTYVIVVQYKPLGNINAPGQFRLNVPVPSLNALTEDHRDIDHGIKTTGNQSEVNGDGVVSQSMSDSKVIHAFDETDHINRDTDVTIDGMHEIKLSNADESNACIKSKYINDTSPHVLDEIRLSDEDEMNMLAIMKDNFYGDSRSSSDSSSSYGNSAEDILISFEDNQDEIFKEQLVGRGLLGRQIANEMIRDLVNERLEYETLTEDLIEYGMEPKRLAFDTQSSVSASIEQKDENMPTGTESDYIRDIDMTNVDISYIPESDANDIADRFERQSSVSASIEQEGDDFPQIDDVENDVITPVDVTNEDSEYIMRGDIVSERMDAIADFFERQSSVSASIEQENDGMLIEDDDSEHRRSDIDESFRLKVDGHEREAVEQHDAERRKHLNRKFVVRINSHSDRISDV